LRRTAAFRVVAPEVFAAVFARTAFVAFGVFVFDPTRPDCGGTTPFRVSFGVTTGCTSLAGSALNFFELFAIYFSFTSASLYALSKPVQEEIGMKEASANSTNP
jgi:hypothetical protein